MTLQHGQSSPLGFVRGPRSSSLTSVFVGPAAADLFVCGRFALSDLSSPGFQAPDLTIADGSGDIVRLIGSQIASLPSEPDSVHTSTVYFDPCLCVGRSLADALAPVLLAIR